MGGPLMVRLVVRFPRFSWPHVEVFLIKTLNPKLLPILQVKSNVSNM